MHTQLSKKPDTSISSLVLGNCGIPPSGITCALLSLRLPITWSITKLKLSTSLGVNLGVLFWYVPLTPVLCKGAAIAEIYEIPNPRQKLPIKNELTLGPKYCYALIKIYFLNFIHLKYFLDFLNVNYRKICLLNTSRLELYL